MQEADSAGSNLHSNTVRTCVRLLAYTRRLLLLRGVRSVTYYVHSAMLHILKNSG